MKAQILRAVFFSAALFVSSSFAGGEPDRSGYIAHEWGTFTSVQAADGMQMQWNPLTVSELPDFVYSMAWPEGKKTGRQNIFIAKTGFLALQRMETPVIYFYADEPQKLNVSVNFPKGTVTEWYPRASRSNASAQKEFIDARAGQGLILWNNVNILPKAEAISPLRDNSGSHYYAARETDANAIRLETPRGSETEKFLFYRGIGSFETPLKVTQQGDLAETIELRNQGAQELRHLFIYQIQGDQAVWALLAKLAPDESKTVQLQFDRKHSTRAAFQEQVGHALLKALVSEGLYEREASAMVKTWEDSWFAEQGIRILYLLPQQWTDETLPLTFTPGPRQVVRVMVGRAELITPTMETTFLQEMVRYAAGDETARAQAVENVRRLGLGRFSEAVTRRLLGRVSFTREFSNRSWDLLQAAAKAPEPKRLAQN